MARTSRKPTRAVSTKGECLDLSHAGIIVQSAVPGGPHPLDTTLEDAGLITDDQRLVFQQHVFDGVHDKGCSIDIQDIPADADTTLREVRDAVADNAG